MAGWASLIGAWSTGMETNYELGKTQTKQRTLSPEAMNQLIYQVLSSDQGLAALSQGENMSGGHSSSTKAQLAQDMATKLAGELAILTAPETTTSMDIKSTKEGRALSRFGDYGDENNVVNGGSGADPGNLDGNTETVICTELNRQGLLPNELYRHPAAFVHFLSLDSRTVLGYHAWANGCVPIIARSPRLSRFILPIAMGRYEMITSGKFNLLGALTIYVAQPICFAIGSLITLFNGVKNGRTLRTA